MDASNRRPQLPALSYLDVGDVKREEATYQDRKIAPPTTAASPTYHYPTGPPPPYNSHATSTGAAWTPIKSGAHTPPDSRRTSGEESENVKQAARQSLPSISEALGVDSHTSYQPPTTTYLPPPRSPAPASPTSVSRRPYGMETSQPQQQYSSFRQDSAGPQSYPPSEPTKAAYAPHEARPPLHLQTGHKSPHPSQPTPHAHPLSTPAHEQTPSHSSAGSMAPPPSTFSYGYANYTPRYAQSNPPSSQGVGPIYSPSQQYGPPPTPSTGWRAEPARYSADERAPQIYGESVKRHIDLYDLEAALSEIEKSSSSLADFARRYGTHMHQQARAGPSLATLPSIVELDDMMQKGRLQLDSIAKIREVVIAQQAAYEQQAADQRQQHKAYAEQTPMPPPSSLDDDVKAGFANGDTKKRRGRAAPPGRCHSCNRAETPEWRRGPDGARTLCNACGLHYAKLTRKNQSGASKTPQAGNSNLRPKEQ